MSTKILLADDDPAVCQFVDAILRQAGYTVVQAVDGVEAMERVRQSPPDLILLDILMPRRDGLDVLRSLRQNPETSQIPVIMLTQKAEVEDRVKGLEWGADDYVPKPFVPQELLVRIQALLKRSQKVRALGPLMGVLGDWFSVQGIEQLGHELETAREIQFRLLPPALPNLAGVEVGAALAPTKSVGGDFYDFIPMPGGVGFAIGDVSGKGIPGALLMVMVRSLLRATAWELSAPGEIVRRVNRFLYRDLPPSMFVTLVFGVLSLGGGRRLSLANAGHVNPLLLRPGKPRRVLERGGPVLGAFEDSKYPEEELLLEAGDQVVLYTDGLVEATDAAGRALGMEGLAALIESRRAEPPQAVARGVVDEVRGRGRGVSRDDLALLILRASGGLINE
ncbi:MAG: SpoIIE family protein phosphatase [Candidatus Rokubacteria bacterium]|nr:SpoIIE family protein phosphatase [Candidatus Rokubacteria bacterium]MBI2552911.1 SpoIIE family protein phosphatase [Candidatus Rokubacteria bacterium]